MLKQRTIKSIVKTVGIGVHSGRKIELTLRPAAPGTGIVFSRVDLPTPVDIPATATSIGDTRLASVLQKDGVRVSTVEHLMSACAGLGIDNLYVDVTAEEIPIMDGSAATFVFLIQSAGIEEQNAPKRFIKVKKTVEIRDGDKFARLDPYFGFKLKFSIDFRHPAVDKTGQELEVDFANTSYVREIARARTFGFAHEAEMLREMGLDAARIAALVEREYLADHQWGDRWVRLDARTRADFDVRVFAGLVLTGHDRLIDFNCVSSREKMP